MWMQACLLLVAQQAPAASIELVESWPSGTTLDQAELPDAWQVWIEMIDGARRTVNLGHFYAVDEGSSRLTKVIEALERAGKRGVKLRFLVEKNFRGASEATLERLSKIEGLELRRSSHQQLSGERGSAAPQGCFQFGTRGLKSGDDLGSGGAQRGIFLEELLAEGGEIFR